jgi:hypothetical protein
MIKKTISVKKYILEEIESINDDRKELVKTMLE